MAFLRPALHLLLASILLVPSISFATELITNDNISDSCSDAAACNYEAAEDCLYSFGAAENVDPGLVSQITSVDESWMITDISYSADDEAYAGILEVANGTNIGDSFNNVVHFVTLTFAPDMMNVMYGGNSIFGYTDEVGGFSLPMDGNTILAIDECSDDGGGDGDSSVNDFIVFSIADQDEFHITEEYQRAIDHFNDVSSANPPATLYDFTEVVLTDDGEIHMTISLQKIVDAINAGGFDE